MYQPVQPVKTWAIVTLAPAESGVVGFTRVDLPDPGIKKIPVALRSAVLAGIMSVHKILSSEDPAESLSRLGWPEGSAAPDNSIGDKEFLDSVTESLEHFATVWKHEYTIAKSVINSLDSALMCLAKPPENQIVDAFCPKQSKGFARVVTVGGMNNPASVVAKEIKRPTTIEEMMESIMRDHGLVPNVEQVQHEEINFE